MKKFLAMLLAVAMMFAMVACGGNNSANNGGNNAANNGGDAADTTPEAVTLKV